MKTTKEQRLYLVGQILAGDSRRQVTSENELAEWQVETIVNRAIRLADAAIKKLNEKDEA